MFIFTYVGFFASSMCVLNFVIMCTCTGAPNIWTQVYCKVYIFFYGPWPEIKTLLLLLLFIIYIYIFAQMK